MFLCSDAYQKEECVLGVTCSFRQITKLLKSFKCLECCMFDLYNCSTYLLMGCEMNTADIRQIYCLLKYSCSGCCKLPMVYNQ